MCRRAHGLMTFLAFVTGAVNNTFDFRVSIHVQLYCGAAFNVLLYQVCCLLKGIFFKEGWKCFVPTETSKKVILKKIILKINERFIMWISKYTSKLDYIQYACNFRLWSINGRLIMHFLFVILLITFVESCQCESLLVITWANDTSPNNFPRDVPRESIGNWKFNARKLDRQQSASPAWISRRNQTSRTAGSHISRKNVYPSNWSGVRTSTGQKRNDGSFFPGRWNLRNISVPREDTRQKTPSNTASSKFTNAQKRQIVQLHNEIRKSVIPRASNMKKMVSQMLSEIQELSLHLFVLVPNFKYIHFRKLFWSALWICSYFLPTQHVQFIEMGQHPWTFGTTVCRDVLGNTQCQKTQAEVGGLQKCGGEYSPYLGLGSRIQKRSPRPKDTWGF